MFRILKLSILILIEIIKRNLPEIKKGCQLLAERAFLIFDFWATIAYELLDITVLCLVVFIKWSIQTEFCRELKKATVQTIACPIESINSMFNSIRKNALSAWIFRKELIAEYA